MKISKIENAKSIKRLGIAIWAIITYLVVQGILQYLLTINS